MVESEVEGSGEEGRKQRDGKMKRQALKGEGKVGRPSED